MASVTVRNESGEIVERRTVSREAFVVPDNQEPFDPAVVQRVEYDHTGQTSSITSVCGETENRRESDEQPDLTVEGIITKDQIPTAKNLKEGDEVTLISDVHQGQVYIKRLTVEQNTDVIHYIPEGSEEEQLAFTFSLQLGQPGTSTD